MDKGEPGNSWQSRYKSIKLHTARYTDHYPFLKFPTNWPVWADQEHIVRWMRNYGEVMGLNIRARHSVVSVRDDDSTQRYSVDIESKDGAYTIHPKHVCLATGPFGSPIRATFPGQDSFKGQIIHTSDHRSAALMPDVRNKKITVIGSGTSAHDVAQDFVNHGAAAVTMVQRNPVFVLSLDSLEKMIFSVWNIPGISTEDADLLAKSIPTPVIRTLSIGETQMIAANDKALLDGLEKAGMAVKRGTDGISLADYQVLSLAIPADMVVVTVARDVF